MANDQDTGTTGNPVTVNVLGNDTDKQNDIDPASVKLIDPVSGQEVGSVTVAGQGTWTANTDGTVTFTPVAGFTGDPTPVSYTASDKTGLKADVPATITIDYPNNPPVANGDSYRTNEDTPKVITPLLNDTDVDKGDVLTITEINGVALTPGVAQTIPVTNGTVSIAVDGTITFTPAKDFSGTVSFPYTISDGHGGTATGTETITVAPVNDAPVAQDDTGSVVQDATLTTSAAQGVLNTYSGTGVGSVGDTDVDKDALSVTAIRTGAESGTGTAGSVGSSLAGAYGHLTLNADGSYSYVADNAKSLAAGATASDVFTYTVSDGHGGTDTAQLTITVTGSNDAPVANKDVADAQEAGGTSNGTAGINPTGNVLSNDTDVDTGDTLTVQTTGTFVGKYGTLVLNADGSYTYTVDNTNATVNALPDYSSTLTDTFSYTMKDAAGATSTSQLVVTVHGQNDAPVAVNDTNTVTKSDPAAPESIMMYVSTNDADAKVYSLDSTNVSNPVTVEVGKLISKATYVASDGNTYRAGTSDIAIMPDGTIYAVHSKSSTLDKYSNISALNTTSGISTSDTKTITYNGTALKSVTSLGSDGDGNLYAATESGSTGNSWFYKIDPTTGVATRVGDQALSDGASGDVAYFDGAMYVTLDNATVAKLDLETGKVTKFMDLPTPYFFGISFDQHGYMWLTDAGSGNGTGTDKLYYYDMKLGQPAAGVYPTNTGKVVNDGTSTVVYGMGSYVKDASVTGPNTVTITGDVTPGTTGQDSDVDTGHTAQLSVTKIVSDNVPAETMVKTLDGTLHISGEYGWIDIKADGSYTYNLDQSRTDTQNLGAGATAHEKFDYTITDPGGLTSTATIDITVNGKASTLDSSIWNDTYIIHNADFAKYDASYGTDTLKVANTFGQLSIGSTELAKLTSIEKIDLTNATGVGSEVTQKVTITASDVFNLNDKHIVSILGDAADTVGIDASWTKVTSDKTGYNEYTATNGAKLYIDTDITHII